jgi:DNA-binding CsgD family transcriptional regulator
VHRTSYVVIEGGAPDALERACAEMTARGLRVVRAFSAAGPGTAFAGEITGERGAQQAVLAALAGAHLVVVATAAREVTDMLCEDLRRLGALDHRVGGPDTAVHGLGDTERALLEHLLRGDSLGQAALALHLSRRTADRRLAAARQALGAATTAEALAIAVRIGLKPPEVGKMA